MTTLRTLKRPKQFAPDKPYVARIIADDTTIHRLIEANDDLDAFWLATESSIDYPNTRRIGVKPLARQTTFQHPFTLGALHDLT